MQQKLTLAERILDRSGNHGEAGLGTGGNKGEVSNQAYAKIMLENTGQKIAFLVPLVILVLKT